MGHSIVKIAIRGLPQEAADLHVARARVNALRGAFDDGARMLHEHVMEHFAIANLHGNRARLADFIKKDIKRFILGLLKVSDLCSHSCAYPPAVGAFPAIPGPFWPRLRGYVASGGLINADVHHPTVAPTVAAGAREGECRQWTKNGKCRFGATCVFTYVGSARAAGSGNKRLGATGGGSADGGTDASVAAAGETPAKKAKNIGKTRASGSGSGGGGSGSGGSGGGSGGSGSGNGGSGGGSLPCDVEADRRAYGSSSARGTDCTSRVGVC